METLESMRIGLIQAELSWREPLANREHLQELLLRAGPGLDVAILPETFTTGFLGDESTSEEGMDGPTLAWMAEMAQRLDCVVTGSAVIATPAGRRNRLLWVEPTGEVRYYDKRHLFGYGGENERYLAGKERVVWDYRGWRVCPQICYDIRFPVWCRNRSDYDLLLVVANWPEPRVAAWNTLLCARAIENQSFVAAVNRVGLDGFKKRYPGRSVVHGPLGDTLLLLEGEEAVEQVTIRLTDLQGVRRKLPFLADADAFTLES